MRQPRFTYQGAYHHGELRGRCLALLL